MAKTQKSIDEKTNVYINVKKIRQGGRALSDEQYSDREPEYQEIQKITIHKTKGDLFFCPGSIEIDKNLLDEKGLFLVIVLYQTGDTFGTSYGNHHIVNAYKTEEEANNKKDGINKHYEEYQKTGKYTGYCPWIGYFERLENVLVEYVEFTDAE